MPTVAVLDMQGKEVGKQELSEAVFGIEPNVSVMNDMVKNYLANQRQGTQSALTRAEVSGGGRKPWRQKGTGRARQGSTRAPQWTHGGIVFAPKPRCYRYTLNKKVKRLAMKSALSSKVRDNEMIVLDSLTVCFWIFLANLPDGGLSTAREVTFSYSRRSFASFAPWGIIFKSSLVIIRRAMTRIRYTITAAPTASMVHRLSFT